MSKKKFFNDIVSLLDKIITLENKLFYEEDEDKILKKEKKLSSLSYKILSKLANNHRRSFDGKNESLNDLLVFIEKKNNNEMTEKFAYYVGVVIDRFTLGDFVIDNKEVHSLYVPFTIPIVIFDNNNKISKNKDIKIETDKFVKLFKKHNLLKEHATVFIERDLHSVDDININFDQQTSYINNFLNKVLSTSEINEHTYISPFNTINSSFKDLNGNNPMTHLRFISGGFLSSCEDMFPVISDINNIEDADKNKEYLNNLTNFFKDFGCQLKDTLKKYNIDNVVHGFPSELTNSIENGALLLDSVTLSSVARRVNLLGAERRVIPQSNVIINPKNIYVQFKIKNKVVSLFKITSTYLPRFDVNLTLQHIEEVLNQECYKTVTLRDMHFRDESFYWENDIVLFEKEKNTELLH